MALPKEILEALKEINARHFPLTLEQLEARLAVLAQAVMVMALEQQAQPPAPTAAEAECRHPWVRHEYLWAETLGPYGVRCLDCRAVAIYQWLPLSKQTLVHPMRMT